jgi:hypothetical protein
MKKFLTILVALTVTFGAVSANAIDKPKSPVGMAIMKTGGVYKLFYKGAKAGDVRVTIFNANGTAVFKETLHQVENFMRPYNFGTLAAGTYTIEIESEDGKQVQLVNHRDSALKASAKLMSLIHMAGGDDKYVLTVANKGEDELTIRIYNADDVLIHKETQKINGDFAKVFNFDASAQDFIVEVTDQAGNTQSLTNNHGR